MFQHLVVGVLFLLCLYFVARRIVRVFSRTKHEDSHCCCCTETSCPLCQASQTNKNRQECASKNKEIAEKCKKNIP